jgi:DUF4097 and DUF4098 domain-containing protein YvlB
MSTKLHRVASIAFASFLGVHATGCVDISAGNAQFVDTVEKRFPVTGTPTVALATFDGGVEVSTWDRPEVLVVIEKRAIDRAAADQMQVKAEQAGDRINVSVTEHRDRGFHLDFGSFSARVIVTVPVKAAIEAETGDGSIRVRDVAGNLRVSTGDGSIRLERVNGAIEASSGDGSIEVEGAIQGLKVRSGDGRIRVFAEGRGPATDWTMSTGDGSVVLEVPEDFNANLDATTGDGRVDVRDVPFSGDTDERASRRQGIARGQIGSGGARITIRSGDGSITVRRAGAEL